MKRDFVSSNEIAFADVAMAVLGPILLLLVVFIVLATGNNCPDLSSDELKRAALGLQQWITDTDYEERRAAVHRRCPELLQPSGDAGTEKAYKEVPAPLAGYCPGQWPKIIQAAFLSEEQVMLHAQEVSKVDRAAVICFGGTEHTCEPVRARDRQRKANELSQWYEDEQRAELEDMKSLERLCTADEKRSQPRATPTDPPLLQGICHEDTEALARMSRRSLAEIRALAGRRQMTLLMLRRCLTDVDIPTPRDARLHFLACSTVPAKSSDVQEEMPDEDLRSRLRAEADHILSTLKADPKINRVDFFGHTDSRRIRDRQNCQPDTIRDNLDLSFHRAKYFKERMLERLAVDPDIAPRLGTTGRNALRFYAIGVADEELQDKNRPEADVNRRIEIRFVTEGRQQQEGAQ